MLLIPVLGTFLHKLSHFSDSSETVDSRRMFGSSPEVSFLAREITYLTGLVSEAQQRETGSIESEGDLRGGSRWLETESVIQRISGFFT